MIYRIVVAQGGVAVEALSPKGVLERIADRPQGNPFAPEEVACNVGYLVVEESIDSPDVFHPHDFQRGLEKPSQPRQTGRDTRHKDDHVAVSTQGSPRYLVVKKR